MVVSEKKIKNIKKIKRAVIADDEPIVRLDLASMLDELGFFVAGEASDGFDAVELCRAHRPDVVFMDIKMPIFDGFAASETIVNEELAGCVILLTAFCDEEFAARAARIGVSGYLVKPIDSRALMPAVEVAMAQSARLRESRRETADAVKKLDESRVVERAKALLARERGISEGDAYREMQRVAMDKRRSIFSIAEAVVRNRSPREERK